MSKRSILWAVLVLATLASCATAPQSPSATVEPAVVAKCGPAPTRALGIGRPGSLLGTLTAGGETTVQFQQRQALYALCARGDPSYPELLREAMGTDAQRQQTEALEELQSQLRAQQTQDFVMQSQQNFWSMVGAMNGLPR
jgi:hypothetical protein